MTVLIAQTTMAVMEIDRTRVLLFSGQVRHWEVKRYNIDFNYLHAIEVELGSHAIEFDHSWMGMIPSAKLRLYFPFFANVVTHGFRYCINISKSIRPLIFSHGLMSLASTIIGLITT